VPDTLQPLTRGDGAVAFTIPSSGKRTLNGRGALKITITKGKRSLGGIRTKTVKYIYRCTRALTRKTKVLNLHFQNVRSILFGPEQKSTSKARGKKSQGKLTKGETDGGKIHLANSTSQDWFSQSGVWGRPGKSRKDEVGKHEAGRSGFKAFTRRPEYPQRGGSPEIA